MIKFQKVLFLLFQVHVSKERVTLYEQISELQGVFTADSSARIHACSWQVTNLAKIILPIFYVLLKKNINPFTTSCENTMTLSVPGVPASCEKFPHSSQ
jgi:hypothetical protein